VVFGSTFRGRAGKSPDVFALPCTTAFVGAPRGAALSRNQLIAPMASTNFALPLTEGAGNAFGDEGRQLEFVNCMFRRFAFCCHERLQTITLLKHFVDTVEILVSYSFCRSAAMAPLDASVLLEQYDYCHYRMERV
jgi:hypothetical protein